MAAKESNTALAFQLYRMGLLNTSNEVLAGITSPSVPDWQLRATIALDQPKPDRSTAEQDYWPGLQLEPTNANTQTQLLRLANQLKDQAMINQVKGVQLFLPTN